jgi:hypothetical protein
MVNNMPSDPYLNCSWHKDLTSFMKVENLLVEKNYDLLNNQIIFNNWS